MDYSYWQKQNDSKPLFPDVAWSRPERRDQAGKLAIIGGNKLGFSGVAAAYTEATQVGAGQVRVLLPDALKSTVPRTMTDVIFGASNPSGSLARDALTEMHAIGTWATGVLLIGDAGRNSETAITYEDFLREYEGQLTITRDAVDLVKNSAHSIVERPNTLLVLSFAQAQKLFQSVYYPKILTFSMQLTQLVEALHKFTITYPVAIALLHRDHMLIAHGGAVVSQDWDNPLRIWRGTTAATMASYWLWHPNVLEAAATSITN